MRNGDFFGEMALFDDHPHTAGVVAMQDSRLLVLHRDEFCRCLTAMPGVAFGLLRALSTRVQEAGQTIGGLILLDVTGRVARLYLPLADDYGTDSEIPKAPHASDPGSDGRRQPRDRLAEHQRPRRAPADRCQP